LEVFDIALGPRAPPDLVARPGKATHAQILVRTRELQISLHPAGFEQPLDHCIAIEEDGVALGEVNFGCDERRRGDDRKKESKKLHG
ncbi:MAG: hypothetical protein ACK55I_40795, partial [bacterium]